MTVEEARSRIIWSADVLDEAVLMSVLDQMSELQIVKVDRLFLEGRDFTVINRLQKDRGLRVFDDAKIIEIPSKMVAIAKKHLAHRPFMLNCMAGGVSSRVLKHEDVEKIDALKRFADACHKVGTKPCGVTVLTSKTEEVVNEEFCNDNMGQVLYYADVLLECGFTDIVCSPKELAAIRGESRFDELDLNTPGIRPSGSSTDDQARTDTPAAAIRGGATRLIIGRPITDGDDPAKNLEAIAREIAAAA